ncbi:MAG: N-acetylmuramoyl-L-alanine amidase [Paludibacter sp.]|nr:N-acetylmuramoyl-L-alanine amidase [Paludibacter sp.]MDD4427057.1 N-acetylmuramoyl-L-alanine amidase [Paludibacter sp.]
MKSGIKLLLSIILLHITMPVFPVVEPEFIPKTINFGHKQAHNRKIDVIIIHSVYNASGGDIYDVNLIIKQFARYKVSPHYLIDREGKIYRMVKDKDIAYHAGVSSLPDGSSGINNRSIGIEIITSLDEAPSAMQIDVTVKLVKHLLEKYPVKYVLRHSDIAPGRKTDPWNMNWEGFIKRIKEKTDE